MSGKNLEQSRGKPTIAELYNLSTDIAEAHDLSQSRPQVVARMTAALTTLIARGATRDGQKATNDTSVRFDTIQTNRWGAGVE